MKTGKSIVELATEIQRQAAAKVDYVANTTHVVVEPVYAVPGGEASHVELVIKNGVDKRLGITQLAHRQIGERIGITAKYYDRMRAEDPELLAYNINRWFQRQPQQRMVRALDGDARAFLSVGYQRIDNLPVAEACLPILVNTPGIEIVSSDITTSRLYIKAVTHSVRATIQSREVGDVIEAGVCISNSEVGLGQVSIVPFVNRLRCKNGMVLNDWGHKTRHVGTKADVDDNIASILADDTKRAIDKSILLKVRDVVMNAMSQVQIDKVARMMGEQSAQKIMGNPVAAVEVLANDFAFNDTERDSVLRHLIEGADLSRFGLLNAVTRTAEDLQSYDRATEFEIAGGRILDLPSADWNRIAIAA